MGGLLDRLKIRFMAGSRERKMAHFRSLYHGGLCLDVGVEGTEWHPDTNAFMQRFPGDGAEYVGLGVEDLSAVRRLRPDKALVRYAGDVFPFKDRSFAWAFSNAVLEHVGGEEEQVRFIDEMLRVAGQAFFTTPNRAFPVEAHTNVLFLHWMGRERFEAWCARHRPWLPPGYMRLLDRRDLERLMGRSRALEWRITPNRILGLTATFTVVARCW